MDLSNLSDEELEAILNEGNPQPAAPVAAPEDVGMGANIGRAAAKGVVSTLGFPGEVALAIPKAGAYLAGDEGSIDYLNSIDPTGTINSILNQAGIRTDPEPGNFRERMASNTAEAIAGGMTGLGFASQASGIVRQGTQKLMAGRLGRFAAEDAASATAGAAVRSVAQEAGLGDPAASIGEFGASMLTGGILGKAQMAMEGFAAMKNAPAGFKASERAAAKKYFQGNLAEFGEDPEAVRNALVADGPEGSRLLTPGARSGSTALQAIENSIIKSNPELQNQLIQSKKDLNTYVSDELRAALGGDGVPQDFIDNYRQGSDWAIHVSEKNRQSVIEQAWKEISDLPPDMDYSSAIKRKLDEAKKLDRDLESELWDKTGAEDVLVESGDPNRPFLKESWEALKREIAEAGRGQGDKGLPDKSTMGRIREIVGDVSMAQPDAISRYYGKPPEAPQDPTATVKELLALRSSLLDDAAEASASQNGQLARRLNALADGVLNTFDGVSGESAEAITQARKFSKDLNDRYSRDVIAPLLAQSASRGEKVAGNEVMGKLLKPSEPGRTAFRALKLAMGEMPKEASDYVLQKFYKDAIGEDGIDVKKAEKFISDFKPALEEAGLMDIVSSYVVTGRAVNKANVEAAALTQSLEGDVIAKFLRNYGTTNDDIVNFVASSLKSEAGASQAKLKEMFDQSLTDVSGNAFRGLKSAVVDGALKAFYTAGDDVTKSAATDLPRITSRVVNALEATGQFTPEQLDRVSQLGTILNKQASSERLRAFKGQSNTPQDLAAASALSNVARMAALKWVAPVVGKGPGSLRAASIVSDMAGKLAGVITKDNAESLIKGAIFDQDLMAALLENPQTISPKSVATIKGFLKGVGRVAFVGGARPSQVTILNDAEQEDGR